MTRMDGNMFRKDVWFEYSKNMLGFERKRFIITLVLSILIWYGSVIIQGLTGINAPFGILGSESRCNLSGFPVAECIYSSRSSVSVWLINITNIIFWFWLIHLVMNLFFKKR